MKSKEGKSLFAGNNRYNVLPLIIRLRWDIAEAEKFVTQFQQMFNTKAQKRTYVHTDGRNMHVRTHDERKVKK